MVCFPHEAGKGFWSEMLGVGDFYYELGVQIIEVCLALKHRNGGTFYARTKIFNIILSKLLNSPEYLHEINYMINSTLFFRPHYFR